LPHYRRPASTETDEATSDCLEHDRRLLGSCSRSTKAIGTSTREARPPGDRLFDLERVAFELIGRSTASSTRRRKH
jgi:hypothetical protein